MSRSTLGLCVALLAVAACDDEEVPVPAPVAKPKRADPVAQRAEAASLPVDNYIYSPIGKRDPFRPFTVDQALLAAEKDDARALTDLEKLEIDQMKLVGIVSGTSTPTAMFEDPEGKGWVVRIGTPMGRNGGKVNKIKKDEVVIMEEYRDPATNKKVQSPVVVKLPSDEVLLE